MLYEQLMKYHDGVDRYEEWFVTSLLQDDDGSCVGAIARHIRDGHMEVFGAKSVIQASGGAGQAFKPTTNALICTGDGLAQSYRIGAPLMDMEMVQYHPTTLVENGFLITEGARGEGAQLFNKDGERFMENYAPNKMELASRDVVSRAEQTEINEGRGDGERRHQAGHHAGAQEAHPGGAARDREHRARLRRRGHHARADHDPPRPALHHGRRAHRRERADARPRPLRRGRSAPACRSTAATAWARTRCWTR